MNILSELIKIPSFSGKEEKIAEFIFQYLKIKGINPIKQNKNVIIYFQGKDKTKAIIFNAHIDTVSAGNLSAWKYDPFGGINIKDKIFGLGASDDKSGVAALCLLAKYFKKNQPLCDVWITFVTSEETDSSGTKSFLSYFKKYKNKYKETTAIIAESTDSELVEIGHRGSIKIKITTYGESGHGSRPYEVKKHAIKKTINVITKMESLQNYINKNYYDKTLGFPTIALTGISSDESSLNKIPDSCFSFWDIRTVPALHNKCINILQKKFGKSVLINQLENPGHAPVFLSGKEKIVSIFLKTETKIKIAVSPGSNDMYLFIDYGIPAVSFGPGTKSVIHKENEYAEIKKIEKAIEIYKKIIISFSKP